MKQSIKSTNKGSWNTLSESEKEEVMEVYEESKDEKNLIANKAVLAKHKKWLKK